MPTNNSTVQECPALRGKLCNKSLIAVMLLGT